MVKSLDLSVLKLCDEVTDLFLVSVRPSRPGLEMSFDAVLGEGDVVLHLLAHVVQVAVTLGQSSVEAPEKRF